MNQKPLFLDPAFAIPLTPPELHLLGCMAVVWGQIDYILDEILAHANAFDADQRTQFLTDKLVGLKADMLGKDYTRLPRKLHADCLLFVQQIGNIKGRRNDAFHGLWGWHTGKRGPLRQVAAFRHKTRNNPLKPVQFRAMLEEMVECSKTGGRVMSACLGWEFRSATQFSWGHEAPEGGPPERLTQVFGPARKGRRPQDRKRQARRSPPKAAEK